MIINLWSLCAHQRAIPDPTAASGERWFVLHVRLAVDMPLALPRVTQPTADLPTPRATSNIVRLANSRRMTPSQRRVTVESGQAWLQICPHCALFDMYHMYCINANYLFAMARGGVL